VLPRTGSAACKIAPAPVGLSAVMGKKSDTRHGEASATLPPTARINHVGESLDVGAFRESLERIQTEIDFCLKGLAMVEGGGMGRALSPNSRARAVSAMGFKVTRPKSKVLAISKSARASKGKGPLVCPADRPKVFMAKEGQDSAPLRNLRAQGLCFLGLIRFRAWSTGSSHQAPPPQGRHLLWSQPPETRHLTARRERR